MPLTRNDLPLSISFFADATGVGKSLGAARCRYLFDEAGIPTTLVRIETRGVAANLRRGDVFIPIEDFTAAARLPGGIAGVLQPYSNAVLALAETKSVVISDWAGGLARHHAEYLVATHSGALLAELGITTLDVVVATNRLEHMREAAANLRMLATVAPRMKRALLLNHRFGGFSFLAGSQAAAVYRELMQVARDGCAVIEFPAVGGDSWKVAEDARMSLVQVIRASPAEFAKRTKIDILTAAACITEVAAFYEKSEVALQSALQFQAAR